MAASSFHGVDDRARHRIALAFHWGTRTRRVSLRTPVFYIGAAMLALTALWSLGATLYVFCGDDLIATMLAREVSTQYEYEDRLATMRTALERETGRHLLLQSEIETQMRSLSERQAAVESRAAVLKTLTERASAAPDQARPPTARATTPNPLLSGAARALPPTASAFAPAPAPRDDFALRLGGTASDVGMSQAEAPEQRSDAAPTDFAPKLARLAETLAHQEQSQVLAIAALRKPAQLQAGRIRTALARVGIPAALGGANDGKSASVARGLGGPFVPLPGDAAGAPFWTAVSLAGDDIAELSRLQRLAASVPLRQPLPGTLDVSSDFGPRLDPFLGRPAMHTGVDLHGESGARVYATAAGTVTIAERDGGYGNLVEIDHGNGLSTRYAHLSTIMVTPRQRVEAGEAVALVGSTGRATGPHLHYETRIAGEPVDPSRFLKAGALLAATEPSEVVRTEK